jgi:hypothetical protein
MTRTTSKRAQLLRRALEYLNEGKYEDWGEQVWFGDGLGGYPPEKLLDQTEKGCIELQREVSEYFSRRASSERTTLGQLPTMSPRLSAILKMLERMPQRVADQSEWTENTCSSHAEPETDDEDNLDRHYSAEVLDKLDGIVRRAVRLGKVRTSILPNRKVQISFEEAHRCHLYGFQHACTVFCRAILEAALKEIVDPDKRTNGKIYSMIELAEENGRLSDDRPFFAREVDKAGNLAIHEPEKFDRRYSAEQLQAEARSGPN